MGYNLCLSYIVISCCHFILISGSIHVRNLKEWNAFNASLLSIGEADT